MSTESTSGISRRTLAKGAAWAVPAVAVTAAAPVYAASPPEECVTVAFTGDACKEPGNATPSAPKAYNLSFLFTNTCATGCVQIVVTDVFKPRGNDRNLYLNFDPLANPFTPTAPGNTFELCAGESFVYSIPTTYSSNSAQGISIDFTVNGNPVDAVELPSPPDCEDAAAATTSRAGVVAEPEGTDAAEANVQDVTPAETVERVEPAKPVPSEAPVVVESPSSAPVATETPTPDPSPTP